MDIVYENSVSAIALLQNKLHQQSGFMFLISNLFDPRYAFLFYCPLVFSFDFYTGRKLIWATVITEWSNQILKWMLHGERPYWWIHETQVYNKTGIPDVQQYFITCETGPGSPSGHAMATASVFYIIIEAILKKTDSKINIFKSLVWSIYTILICMVSLSRVYIAAHFPHQCFLGGITGVAVAMLISHLDTSRLERRHYTWGSLFLISSAMLTYVFLKMLGMNPMWSVDRALKWCVKPEYVHMNTTPFFSIMRYTGFFFGIGIGLTSILHKQAKNTKFTTTMKIITAVISIAVSKASESIKLPTDNTYLFYANGLITSAIFGYLFTAFIPYLVTRAFSSKVKAN